MWLWTDWAGSLADPVISLPQLTDFLNKQQTPVRNAEDICNTATELNKETFNGNVTNYCLL